MPNEAYLDDISGQFVVNGGDYNFVGNKTDVEQMIGNAVPVNLAKFVGEAINKYVASPHQNRSLELDFEKWELEDRLAWCASEPMEDR